MKSVKTITFIISLLLISFVAFAADDSNTGLILKVGKVTGTVCTIKVKDAIFTNSCSTAVYQEAYFLCDGSVGGGYLSIALSAYMAGKPVRIVTDSCWASSVANLKSIYIE